MPPLPNVRQEKFVQGLFEGKSATQSYIDAGYKPHQGNSSRLRWFEMVQTRLAELQAEAAKKCEVTVESLFEELEQARQKATDLNQLSAAVRATGEKIKLSGLAVQKVEVSQSQFTDDMTIQEILDEVIAERGMKAAYHLAMAHNLNPREYGIKFIEGEVIASESGKDRFLAGHNGETHQTEGNKAIMREGGKAPEMRPPPAVSVDFGGKPPAEWKPPRRDRRREL